MTELFSNMGTYIHTNPWLAILVVFAGGILTASNPCVLAMIPLMMSFVAGGREGGTSLWRAFRLSLLFVLGLAITFTAMGIIAALAGSMYGDVSGIWNWVVAAVCILMGLHLLGILNINIPNMVKAPTKTRGALGALLLGLLFGFVSAPCAAPILVVLLTYLAGSGASVAYGGLLLLVYSLGHSVLIIIAGTSMGAARKLIESKNMNRTTALLRRIAGGIIVIVGIFFALRAI